MPRRVPSHVKLWIVIGVLTASVGLQSLRAQVIDLRNPNPIVPAHLSFRYQGAGYDSYYQHHWLIAAMNGFIRVGFDGPRSVTFRALGSTINGVSYCRINIFVDGRIFRQDMFVGKEWKDYFVPAMAFARGRNTVTIQLVGRTHLWIDSIRIGVAGRGVSY